MRRSAWILAFTALVAGAPVSAPAVQNAEFLGFEVGEERHYVLGPPEALQPGEAARWSISLTETDGSGERATGVFALQHVREAPREAGRTWLPGQVTHAQVDATLEVDAHGAPLRIAYRAQRHIYDIGDELFEVEYRHRGDHYEKRVQLQGADWDLDVDLGHLAGLDPGTLRGLVVFAPAAADCLEWRVGTVLEYRTGTGDVSAGSAAGRAGSGESASVSARGDTAGGMPVVEAATDEGEALATGRCFENNTDPAFANPGLLSLAMPVLWERRGDADMELFSPLRPDLVRGQGNPIPLTLSPIVPSVPVGPGSSILSGVIPGLDLGALIGGDGVDGDKDRARDPARHFFSRRLTLSERQRIDVGRRRMDALPLGIAGYGGTVWVDDWGEVLRLDLPPLRHDDAQRWIRLLHASEY